jgi:transcriptional regulator with XRE-family HTH domain
MTKLKIMPDTSKETEIPQCVQTSVMPSLLSLNFKSMRKSKGLTLRKVEEITGISNAYLSQLETGKIKQPSYTTVVTLLMLYSDILGLDSSWSLKDVLKKLIEASEILLHQKNYDGHGWEEINHCVERGKEIVSTLSGNEA